MDANACICLVKTPTSLTSELLDGAQELQNFAVYEDASGQFTGVMLSAQEVKVVPSHLLADAPNGTVWITTENPQGSEAFFIHVRNIDRGQEVLDWIANCAAHQIKIPAHRLTVTDSPADTPSDPMEVAAP